MAQEFKSRFYKKVRIGGRDFYLFKEFDRIDKGKWGLTYIRVTSDRAGDDFVVESGAGITQARMEKQIMNYLKRKFD